MFIEDCNYSEALNLTTRLLAMYGQGPGQMGYPSKHTKHSLQVMFIYNKLFIVFNIMNNILVMANKIFIVGENLCMENRWQRSIGLG